MDVLCEACSNLKWTTPTAIQKEALPVAFQGSNLYPVLDPVCVIILLVSVCD